MPKKAKGKIEEMKKLKRALLKDAIMAQDIEVELPSKTKGTKGKWIIRRELKAVYQQENGRSIEVEWSKHDQWFEMIVKSGYGRSVLFYEDEIPLIKEAEAIIKEMRKYKKLCPKKPKRKQQKK